MSNSGVAKAWPCFSPSSAARDAAVFDDEYLDLELDDGDERDGDARDGLSGVRICGLVVESEWVAEPDAAEGGAGAAPAAGRGYRAQIADSIPDSIAPESMIGWFGGCGAFGGADSRPETPVYEAYTRPETPAYVEELAR